MIIIFCFTEIRKYGDNYGIGQLLFISDTNNVDVTFTTSRIGRRSGFSLDVRSSSCTELDFCDGPVQEVEITAGVTLEDAIVSDTHSNGKYRHNACQDWKITTDDNQVYIVFQRKVCTLYCMKLIYYNLFQCIVVTVGDGGFLTEDWVDTVVFMDSGSFAGIKFTIFNPLFERETDKI